MLQLFSNTVYLSRQPRLGCILNPPINQVKQLSPEVGRPCVAYQQKLGQFLAGTFQKKLFLRQSGQVQGASEGRAGVVVSLRKRSVNTG